MQEFVIGQRWISAAELEAQAQPMLKNGYGRYLLSLLK